MAQVTKTQAEVIERLITGFENNQNMQLIFGVPISQLDRRVQSTTLKISVHSFSLAVFPTQTYLEWHSLYLCLAEDTGRVNSLSVEFNFELVSYSALHPAKKIKLLMSTLQR